MEEEPCSQSLIIGTCDDMCPEIEIILREDRNRVHIFERLPGTRSADREKAVKEYSRPAAGKSYPVVWELRPAHVLLKTTRYLIEKIIPRIDCEWHIVYEFVFDRLRAVRQDMTIQRINDSYAVKILERAIRIMIYAHYRLCEDPPSNFDRKINSTHIAECLKRLLCLYAGDGDVCRCHQGEFVALYLLFNLCNPEALHYGLELKQILRSSPSYESALSISLAWWQRNYVRVVRSSRRLPVLLMCALHNTRTTILRESLAVMSSGYNSKNLAFPLADLTRVLDLNDVDHAESLCQQCGLDIDNQKHVRFIKNNFKQDVKLKPCLEKNLEEDLPWENLPTLLLGSSCDCKYSVT